MAGERRALQRPRLLRPLARPGSSGQHAFGQVWFTPYVAGGASDALTALFQWYWGKTQGTHSPGIFSNVYTLYNGVMTAGPKLTPKSFNAALGEVPVERRRLPGHDHQPRDRHRAGTDPAARHRARVVGPEGDRRVEPDRHSGNGQVRVPERRQALPHREVPGEVAAVLRRVEVDVAVRRGARRRTSSVRIPCDNCPSTGGSQTPAAAS